MTTWPNNDRCMCARCVLAPRIVRGERLLFAEQQSAGGTLKQASTTLVAVVKELLAPFLVQSASVVFISSAVLFSGFGESGLRGTVDSAEQQEGTDVSESTGDEGFIPAAPELVTFRPSKPTGVRVQ